MQLYKHQEQLLEKNPAKHLICFDTGTGKTIMSMELTYKNQCSSALVICPKSIKEKWKRDWESWAKDKVHKKTGGSAFVRVPKIMSKEEFRKDWEKVGYFEAVIVDEAHYFSGDSAMKKNLAKYLKKNNIKYIWLLTATPYMSTPWNIYHLASHIGIKWNYMKFKDKFFTIGYRGRGTYPVIREGIEPEIARLVNMIGTTVRIDECADIPEQVFETEYFSPTPAQKKHSKVIEETEITPIVRFSKFHQIENGSLKSDGYTKDTLIDADKTARVLELAESHKKIAIVCRYNLQIKLYERELKEQKKPVFVINGETKNKDEIVQKVENLDECIVLINASCSEGYELPSVPVCVFASLSFSYKDYKQMLGRYLRINKLKKNVYIHLVTVGGVDVAVYSAIMKKQDFDMEIYANQYRGNNINNNEGEGLPDGI